MSPLTLKDIDKAMKSVERPNMIVFKKGKYNLVDSFLKVCECYGIKKADDVTLEKVESMSDDINKLLLKYELQKCCD